MNAAHLHLLLNHIPVLGTVFGLVVFAIGQVRKNTVLLKVSLVVFIISGLAAGAAYLTGEPAEDLVEHLAGVSESVIEPHENAAFYALIASVVLGLFALGSLITIKEKVPYPLAVTVMVLALVVSGMMAWTANLGGQIRHAEIRPETVAGQVTPADRQTGFDGDYEAEDDD